MMLSVRVILGVLLAAYMTMTQSCTMKDVTRTVKIRSHQDVNIRTDSETGSNEYVVLYFWDASSQRAGAVLIGFYSPIKYNLGWCMSGWATLPVTPPTQTDKTWRIGYNPDELRVVVHCNEVEVLNVVLSDSFCVYSDWRSDWERKPTQIEFHSTDTASEEYCLVDPAGPVLFRFTQEPQTQDVLDGLSVNLQCTADGRNTVTYSWYKRQSSGLETAPTDSDLISGQTGRTLTVPSTDVDDSNERNMFQCKATAGNDFILSSVATVNFVLKDDIQLDDPPGQYTATVTTESGNTDPTIFLNKLECHSSADIDSLLTNGKPYNVYWYKDNENVRVEDNYHNMWTSLTTFSYGSTFLDSVVVSGSSEADLGSISVKRYDLVLFNLQTSDTGTYKCIAKSEGSEKLIGTTTLNVNAQNNQYTMKSRQLIVGYTVQAVDSSGKQTYPNVGDTVLLMCGTTCKPSTTDGDYDARYQWTNVTSGGIIASTREHTVTITKQGTNLFKCNVKSKCGSLSKTVIFNANAAGNNQQRCTIL